MKEQHVYLKWYPRSWNTPAPLRNVVHSQRFESLEALKKTLRNCTYGGEWVTDAEGNTIDIDLPSICAKESRWEE